MVISGGKENYGIQLYYFRILTALGSEHNCDHMLLLVGVKKETWFEALWKSPCSDSDSQADISRMRASLKVDSRWTPMEK